MMHPHLRLSCADECPNMNVCLFGVPTPAHVSEYHGTWHLSERVSVFARCEHPTVACIHMPTGWPYSNPIVVVCQSCAACNSF
jgi:hypothetical protein